MDLDAELKGIIGERNFELLKLRFPNYQMRPYQIFAVQKVLKVLNDNKNPLLLLDPGLGKTLISQLVFLGLKHSNNKTTKALVLVPSRLLRDQHFKAAKWFSANGNILNIDQSISRVPTALRRAFERANWIISTPKLLYNALNRDYVLRKLMKDISICIVDEFDAQAAEDVDSEGEPIGRFSKNGRALIDEIKGNRTQFFCMSATQRTAAEPWLKTFDLEKIEVEKELINSYSAYAVLNAMPIHDNDVRNLDNIISLIIIDTLRKIRYQLTHQFLVDPEIDADRLIRQASKVFRGERDTIYFPSPIKRYVHILPGQRIDRLIRRFAQAYGHQLFLYEGRLQNIQAHIYQKIAIDNLTLKPKKVFSVGEVEYSRGATATRKINSLVKLIKSRNNQRCLVLVRNTDINKYISETLSDKGIRSCSLIGDMSDKERRESLSLFEKGSARVLVANRELGGRGFDLPSARYAVFISPKRSEETMWQEMLRIRSFKKKPKHVYVYYFSGTREENKMLAFLEIATSYPQKYRVINQPKVLALPATL
jgi:superfamily II DNA/RNA helicase